MPPPKKRPPLTHFLCLPLTGGHAVPQWRASLRRFAGDVAADCPVGVSTDSTTTTFTSTSASTSTPNSNLSTTVNGKGGEGNKIPVKAIRPVGTLHLTIGVMSLKEEGRLESAVECLRGVDLGGLLGGAKGESRTIIREEDIEQGGKHVMDPARREMSGSASAAKLEVIDGKSISSTNKVMQPPEGSTGTASPPPPPLTLSFTGLKSMQSPKSTSFLYVPPTDTTGRLYPFCQSLRNHFTADGFMLEEDRALKLHATILNTIYAGKVFPSKKLVQGPDGRSRVAEGGVSVSGDEGDEHHEQVSGKLADEEELLEGRKEGTKPKGKKKGKRKKQVVKFDARELMERYVDFVWAQDVRIEKVAICEMGAKKLTDQEGEVVGEEYTEVASVPLP
ncbi:hypothetical protein XANCAGTX0491_008867 [Xanthoria calcicola]